MEILFADAVPERIPGYSVTLIPLVIQPYMPGLVFTKPR